METHELLLIFPVGWVPTYPYLALPVLKGYLNTKGIESKIYDDNINFYQTILTKQFFDLVKARKVNWEIKDKYLIPLFEKIDEYKSILQRKDSVKSYEEYQIATNIINNILDFYGREFNLKMSLQYIDCEDYSIGVEGVLNQMLEEDSLIKIYMQRNISFFEEMKNVKRIGFSVTSKFQLVSSLCYCRSLRKEGYKGLLFLGGNYVSRVANHKKEILKQILEYVDFIILYEGEQIIEKFLKNVPIEQIPNIIYKRGNDIVVNPYKDLGYKEAICPDFNGFFLSDYILPELILPLYTSVNCYNNCYFCNISGFQNKNYRQLEIHNVINNIKALKERYNANIFYFVDQTFRISRMIEFAKNLIEKNLSIMWICETRMDRVLYKDEIEVLKKSGCIKLQIGLESYNQRILNLMNKNIKLKDIKDSVQNLIEQNLAFHLFCMYGYPGESIEEIKNTLSYIRSIESECMNNGNEYFSYGLSKFQLEKGSYISLNPQEFGLSLLEENKLDLSLLLHYENERDELVIDREYDKRFELAEAINIDEIDIVCIKYGVKKKINQIEKYEIKTISYNNIVYEIAWDQINNEFVWREITWENTFQDIWKAYHTEEIQIVESNYKVYVNKRFTFIQQKDKKNNSQIIFLDQYSKEYIRGNIYAFILWGQCKNGNYVRTICENNSNIPKVKELVYKMIKLKLLIIAFE